MQFSKNYSLSSDVPIARDSKIHFVSQCQICSHKQLFPISTKQELKEFYDKDMQLKLGKFSIEQVHKQSLIDVERRSKIVPKKGKIMDIGSGYGTFLEKMKNYDITGVEPSIKRRQIAKVKILKNLPKHGKYDTICMFHVLEHLNYPIEYLSNLKPLLNKSGVLIIEVPNSDDIQLKKEKYSKQFWQLAHLHYFNPSTLRLTLKSAGFSKIKIKGVQRYTKESSKISFVPKSKVKQLIKNLKCDTILAFAKL